MIESDIFELAVGLKGQYKILKDFSPLIFPTLLEQNMFFRNISSTDISAEYCKSMKLHIFNYFNVHPLVCNESMLGWKQFSASREILGPMKSNFLCTMTSKKNNFD